jgi:imidazolonepropionase
MRRLHVDQFGDHGGAALAAELKAKTADHLEHTGIEGIRALQAAKVIPVLLPASVYCLGLSKFADARTMIEEGLPVVLATDFNPGTAPCPSLPFVMSLACTQMKMTPAEALTACTINAAHAVLSEGIVGSIEPGKLADIVIHDVEDYREIPYWTGRSTVSQVWIGGRRVFG